MNINRKGKVGILQAIAATLPVIVASIITGSAVHHGNLAEALPTILLMLVLSVLAVTR